MSEIKTTSVEPLSTVGEFMSHLSLPVEMQQIFLFVHVHPMGGLNVQYRPEGAQIPPQTPALFGNRKKLAATLMELNLVTEASSLIQSFAQADFTFHVTNTPQLMETFGFHRIGAIRR